MAGGVRWMFHATAMGPSYDDLLQPLARLFGCRPLHDHVDDSPAVARRGGMAWIGDGSIELGEPVGESPQLRQFIERFGGGMHSFGVQVDDVAASLARAQRFGVEVGAYLQDDIAFTKPSTTAGLVLEWASHVQADDPRWGAPVPPFLVDPAVPAERLAFIVAAVADPAADGEHLAQVLDTELTVLGDGRAVIGLGDCALALHPLADDGWGLPVSRPRCIGTGLLVADLADARQRLAEVGVDVTRRLDEHTVLLLPPSVPFPILLVDELLPGDPRRTS